MLFVKIVGICLAVALVFWLMARYRRIARARIILREASSSINQTELNRMFEDDLKSIAKAVGIKLHLAHPTEGSNN